MDKKFIMMKRYYFFYKTKHPFSQWYRCQFIINDIEYNCTEQYMMYQKALLFNDIETSELILKSKQPRKQKELGRIVKNFNIDVWNDRCKSIVYQGNKAKFLQNPELLKILLNTKGRIIVEANPFDKIWGIGMGINDVRILNQNNWKGTNYLGYILTNLRDELR